MKRNDQAICSRYADSFWDGTHKFQRMLMDQARVRMEYFDSVTRDWEGIRTLDLRCGSGFMSEALAARGARVIGIDPCTSLLEAARAHAGRSGLDINYLEGMGEDIPLPTASVDRVVCVDVLEHVDDPRKVISEIRRVLRRGGLFFFDTLNNNRLSAFLMTVVLEDIAHALPKGSHDPAKFIRAETLVDILGTNGFKCPEEFTGMGMVLDRRLRPRFGLMKSTRIMYIEYAA